VSKVLPRDDAAQTDAIVAPQLAQAWGAAESEAYYQSLKQRFKVELRLPAAKAEEPSAAASK
jgi:peptidyl-prolyl cis-trans isomerase D